MLVLSRKIGEGFDIDDSIKVVILNVNNKQVRLGIQAPLKIKVLRCELKGKEKS